MANNFDLHSHSTVSDGLLSPAELVAWAVRRGIDALALTDHDDVAGLDEAGRAAAAAGIRFVPGVEISVSWMTHSVHIVGLGIDPTAPDLVGGLASIRAGRLERAARSRRPARIPARPPTRSGAVGSMPRPTMCTL